MPFAGRTRAAEPTVGPPRSLDAPAVPQNKEESQYYLAISVPIAQMPPHSFHSTVLAFAVASVPAVSDRPLPHALALLRPPLAGINDFHALLVIAF